MDFIIVIISLLLFFLFLYVILFANTKKKRDKKSYYLKRFIRNREQSIRHIVEVEQIISDNDAWDKDAFDDKATTFTEYLIFLKTNHNADYSEASYEILKKNKLSYSEQQEYTTKLIEQSEALYLMEVDLLLLNKRWRKSVS